AFRVRATARAAGGRRGGAADQQRAGRAARAVRPDRRALFRAADGDGVSQCGPAGDRTIDGRGAGMKSVRALVAPVVSIIFCLALTAVVLAALPSTGDEPR